MEKLKAAYKDKTILVTGHTGFKGSWLTVWLKHLGAKIIGVSLDIPTSPSNFEVSLSKQDILDLRIDIRDYSQIRQAVREYQPDFVFHLAAQALVYRAYEDPLKTFETNAMGSANILEAIRILEKPVAIVMVTSDKCYDNVEWTWGYRENDRLGGKDPYSASKGMAEFAIRSYVSSYFNDPTNNVRLGIARAGNVIGGGDWAKDRIVPDCMRAWSRREVVDIRSPYATRPWQHVLEPLSGYLLLGMKLVTNPELHGEAFNFGPAASQNRTVRDLISEMETHWSNIRWRDVSSIQNHLHEAGLLKLNCDKALSYLEWSPTMLFEETVRMTVSWYKAYYENNNKLMRKFTLGQIDDYMKLADKRNITWACE